METKELIFNGKKFFEGNYIGRTAYNGWGTSFQLWHWRYDKFIGSPGVVISLEGSGLITGQMNMNGEVYLTDDPNCIDWFKLSDLLENGGGIRQSPNPLISSFQECFHFKKNVMIQNGKTSEPYQSPMADYTYIGEIIISSNGNIIISVRQGMH